MRTQNILTGVTGFVIGGVAGGLVALLSAPQSGLKTRALIRDKSVEIKDRVVDRIQDTRAQAVQRVDKVKEDIQTRSSKLLRVGREIVDKEKQLLEQTTHKAQTALQA